MSLSCSPIPSNVSAGQQASCRHADTCPHTLLSCPAVATLSTVMTLRHMDSLPAWAQTLVRRSLKADHGSLQRMPLSKLLAYHTDLWLSKSPTSKIWGLLAGTMLLSLFGGISLFVVSDGEQ